MPVKFIPFYNGCVWERTWFRREVLRSIIYTCQWFPSGQIRCQRLFGIPLHILAKYTSTAFICILLSPVLGFTLFFRPHCSGGWANLRPTLSLLIRAIRWFCTRTHIPFLPVGFNLNEFRRITKVDVRNAVYCHSWAARRGARSNERDVRSPGLICDFRGWQSAAFSRCCLKDKRRY